MRFVLFILVLALTLMIGGRFIGNPAKRPVVASAPTPKKAERAPRTPAPANKWMLSENGLGPVRIDERPEQVAVELGEPFLPVGKEALSCSIADWPSQPEGVQVEVDGGKVHMITVGSDSKVRTDLGIGIGDEASRIVELSRAAGREVRADRNSGMIVVLPTSMTTPAKALGFYANGGRVTLMRAGLARDIDSDPCR